ncbi:MAG: hypothetical protein EA401_07855 [Planctomycetota bacterium]|nr:MAG: hypothetical protein EA401_07855 [Planctomycetota bacterium]
MAVDEQHSSVLAEQLILACWNDRNQHPPALSSDWLQGPWGEVLAAAEQRSRTGQQHVPLSTLLRVARDVAARQQAVAA